MARQLTLSTFKYDLPLEFIAQDPAMFRDNSKLLVSENKKILHRRFFDIINFLKKDDVLVLNQTKVVPNKIICRKVTGAHTEMVLLCKVDKEGYIYKSRVKTVNPLVGGKFILPNDIHAEILSKDVDIFTVKFDEKITRELLNTIGVFPIPPYIRQKVKDYSRYQTVYAKNEGSLAAPTAGLHFTKDLLDKIKKKGVKIAYVTLNVGYGTFIPVRCENIKDHKMEAEHFFIEKKDCEVINKRKGRLIVVGTTSLKALESAADKNGKVNAVKEDSTLFIFPGHEFKIKIDALITNFHLPRSTLLLLVSAFYGWDKIKKIYTIAIKNSYRFYSFGDAMILIK